MAKVCRNLDERGRGRHQLDLRRLLWRSWASLATAVCITANAETSRATWAARRPISISARPPPSASAIRGVADPRRSRHGTQIKAAWVFGDDINTDLILPGAAFLLPVEGRSVLFLGKPAGLER